MRRSDNVKKTITAWVMTWVMAASVIMAPAGKVQAAEVTEIDLQPDTTVTTTDISDGTTLDVPFEVPGAYNTTSKLEAAGLNKLQVKYVVTEYTGTGTGSAGAQPYVVYGSTWDSQDVWNNLSLNEQGTVTLDLPQSAAADFTIGKLGIQFANITGSITYQIISAKLIGDGGSAGGGSGDDEEDDPGVTDEAVTASVYKYEAGSNTYYSEYNYSITNGTDSAISGVKIKIPTTGTVNELQSYGCNVTKSGNYIIISHSSVVEAGKTYTCKGNGDIKFGFSGGAALGTPEVEFVYGTDGGGTSSSELKYELTGKTKEVAFEDTPVGKHGKLTLAKVDDYSQPIIVDEQGAPFQLRGASSHGIQWHDGYDFVNMGAYQSLRDEWGVNMVRLAAYVTQDGYTEGAQSRMDEVIQRGVAAATELGMYVIVDWHIHEENPHTTKPSAEEFFTKYATMYKGYDNVIFEICNEPTEVKWYDGSGADLYSYCKDIAGIIRNCGSDALIVCGTNTWSQDVDDVAKKPLKDDGFDNILYTFHFYSGSHYEDKMKKVRTAIAAGTPIFVTEFGVCDASGNGKFDTNNADEWIKLFDKNGISYCCWSLSSKAESASYLSNSCIRKEGGWVESDLATTGIWLVNTYRAHQDAEEGTSTEVGDFSLSVDPDKGVIPEVEEGYEDPGTVTITVTNTGSKVLEKLTVSFGKGNDNTDFKIVKELDDQSLAPEESDTIEISLKEDKAVGKYADSVIVTSGTLKRVQNISQTVTKKKVELTDIELSSDYLTLEKGAEAVVSAAEEADIRVTAVPDNADISGLQYSSSKQAVATVDEDGIITAVGKGSTAITVSSGSISKTITVNVKVTPQRIDLKDAVSLTLNDDENTEILTAKVLPEDADVTEINWSVTPADNNVIDIAHDETDSSKLIITALSKGTVTITASLAGTAGTAAPVAEIKKDCVVTVTDAIESISISDEDIILSTTEGSNTKQLSAVTVPAGADGIAWSSSNPNAVIVDQSGLITAVGDGEAVITAEVGSKKDTCTVTSVKPIESVSITDSNDQIIENLEMKKGDDIIVTGNVNPKNATGADVLSWSVTKGEDVITFDAKEGKITALKAGSAEITLTAGKDVGEIKNIKTAILSVTVEEEQPDIDISKPYIIDISKLPGGSEYTDNDYLDNLYVTYTSDVRTPTAVYEEGKLTLLLNTDYKLVGINEKLTVSFRENDNDRTDAVEEVVILDGVTVKAVDADVPVKISGNTVIKENVKAESVELSSGTITIGGSINAAKDVLISSGTITVEEGITSSEKITIKNGVKLIVNSAKKADGTDTSAISGASIIVEDGATITASDDAGSNLFSVVPKNQEGIEIDVSQYTGSSSSGGTQSDSKDTGGSSSGSTSTDSKDTGNGNSGSTSTDNHNTSDKKGSDTGSQTVPVDSSADGSVVNPGTVKASDMAILADVKGVKGVNVSGTYQLAKGKAMIISAAFIPEGAVSEGIVITSSDSKIVSVNGNKLTAKKAGTSKITVTSENGIIKTFNIKVMKKADTKLKIKASKKTVKAGKTLKLKAVITPSKKAGNKVYWKSSNEKVATVTQKGIVKGVKKGKVKITAVALDGSGKKVAVKITVK